MEFSFWSMTWGNRKPVRQVWCKMLLMMWTSILILGSVGTLGCCSLAGACGDGWSYPSGAGTRGIQKHVRQSVLQSAVYDLYINYGEGVLGHLGMGLVRWCLWGWMELGSKGTMGWGSRAGASRDGSVSRLEQGPGASKNMCAKVWCQTPVMLWTSTLVLGS